MRNRIHVIIMCGDIYCLQREKIATWQWRKVTPQPSDSSSTQSSSSPVQLFSCVRLFLTLWTAARQASLSIASSRSLLRLVSIELVMPSKHLILILCRPLLLPPSMFPSIRVFSNEFCITWSNYWRFSFSIQWFILLLISWYGVLRRYINICDNLPKMQNFNLIRRKHQINSSWRMFYKIIGLLFF